MLWGRWQFGFDTLLRKKILKAAEPESQYLSKPEIEKKIRDLRK